MMQMDKRGGAAKKMGCMPAMADGGMVPSKPMKMGKPMGKSAAMMAMGAMQPVKMANGGLVKGKGGPTEDNIPAMLSAKEFVMPADTTKAIGPEVLQAIVDATHKPSGKPAMKNGKVAMADGETPEDAQRRAQQEAAVSAPDGSGAGAAITQVAQPGSGPSEAARILSSNVIPNTTANIQNTVDSVSRNLDQGNFTGAAGQAIRGLVTAPVASVQDTFRPVVGGVAALGKGLVNTAVTAATGNDTKFFQDSPAAPGPASAGAAPTARPSAVTQATQPNATARLAGQPAAPAAPAGVPATPAAPAETQVAPGVFRTTGPGGVPLFFDEASRNTNASLLARGAAPSAQNQRAADQLANVELERGRRAVAYEINKENLAKEAATAQAINANTFRSAEAALAGQIKNPTERALAVEFARQQATTNFAAPDKAADRAIEQQRVAVSGRVADADTTRANAAARLSNVEGANAETAARQLASLDAETDPVKRNRLIESIQARTGKGQTGPKFGVTTVAGGSQQANPNDPLSPVVKAADRAFVVNERTGEVQEVGSQAPVARKPPPSPAQAALRADPTLAPAFDAKYGPGAARQVLGK